MTSLDAAGINRLLHALDEELAARGTTADVYLVGGAAIALSFDAARTTRDLDAVFVPTTQVRAAAEAVAEANGLAGDWLNDAVKGFVPRERMRTSGWCSNRSTFGCVSRVRSICWR